MDITGGLKKLRKDLSNMTFREKLDHLWTYYKGTLIIAIVVVLVLSLLTTSLININTTTIVSGVAINVELSEQGRKYLREDYYDKVYDGSGLEKVYFSQTTLFEGNDAAFAEENYYSILSLAALMSEQQLDYMLTNQSSLEYLIKYSVANGNILRDLRDLFTAEELSALGLKVIHMRVGQEDIPVAINLSDVPFIAQNSNMGGTTEKPVYITFSLRSPRDGHCRAIYDYILAWQPAS